MASKYMEAKLSALQILDEVTEVDLVREYSTKFSAQSKLFLDLGIPPERTAVMAPTVNDAIKRFNSSRRVTSMALAKIRTVGEFISLFCKAADIPVEPGEPK